ncbi:MAG: alpha/beta fold hydrolase [Arenicella sp.]
MLLQLDKSFNFQGQSIAWGCVGKGDPVVMVHGFPWSAQSWRKIVPLLAKNKTVYYFDMPGSGQSEKNDKQDVSPASQNDLLAALIEHWKLGEPEVVAHDFGGLAALRAYYINGLRYRKLTLINVVAVLPSGSPFYSHVRNHYEVFAKVPAYAHHALLEAFIQKAAYKPLSREAAQIYAAPWKDDVGQAAFYRQIAQSDIKYIEEIQALYGPMHGQVNLVWGEQDLFIPLNQGKELAKLISADSFTTVPNAGHIVQEDAPEAIVAALFSS